MKVDFNKILKASDLTDARIVVKDDNGVVEKDSSGNMKTEALTFKNRVLDCLLAFGQKESNMKGEEKIKLYTLAMKIQGADAEIDYSIDELKLIKDRCALYMPTLFFGQLNELLESNN